VIKTIYAGHHIFMGEEHSFWLSSGTTGVHNCGDVMSRWRCQVHWILLSLNNTMIPQISTAYCFYLMLHNHMPQPKLSQIQRKTCSM
jgi:hypothetical protein